MTLADDEALSNDKTPSKNNPLKLFGRQRMKNTVNWDRRVHQNLMSSNEHDVYAGYEFKETPCFHESQI